jgi:hypothetical protein
MRRPEGPKRIVYIALVAVVAIWLTACGGSETSNDGLESAFAEGRSAVWVDGYGTIVRELGSTGAEQRFQVRINDELTIVLLRDTDAASPITASQGDRIGFHGRYDFHGGGGTVSRVHPDPSQPGGGGWVELNGVRQD